jgi:uncharacterized protein
MSRDHVDIVRGIYDAWSRGDLEGFIGALDAEVEWRFADNFVYGQVNPIVGREALRASSLKRLRTEWEGFDGILTELLDAGNDIVGLGHYVGTYRGTGKQMRAQFVHVWTLADGKVTRWRQCVDTKPFADAIEPERQQVER